MDKTLLNPYGLDDVSRLHNPHPYYSNSHKEGLQMKGYLSPQNHFNKLCQPNNAIT
jgi:hypothetical protein